MAKADELVHVVTAPGSGLKLTRSEAEAYVKANKGASIQELPSAPPADESPAQEAAHVASDPAAEKAKKS